VDKVFVSSVMRGFEGERAGARRAIESLGLRAMMAETAPASPNASKHALLDLVDAADAVVLILGGRYGYVAEHGLSPTEDEFNHAGETGKPVFVFVQNGVQREREQDEFVRRVQGGWGQGAFTAFFDSPEDLGFAVVQALSAHRDARHGDALPAAQERARRLAVGEEHRGGMPGNSVRVAFAPAGAGTLIDALVLDDGTLGDRAAGVIRMRGLVPQAAGIEVQASSRGIELSAKAPHDFHTTTVALAADGAVLVDADARAEGTMGGMVISYPHVEQIVAAAAAIAQDLWGLLPAGDRVRQVAVTVCVPDANHHPLVLSGTTGGSMSVPTIPSPLVAPDPPLVLRRADVGSAETGRRLAVSLKQAFADHGAVID
jgi:hypothetical protein